MYKTIGRGNMRRSGGNEGPRERESEKEKEREKEREKEICCNRSEHNLQSTT